MEGITYSIYRQVHNRLFPGTDEYYTPFIAPDSKGTFKPKFLKELTCDAENGIKVIPQILTNNPEAFIITAEKLKALGFGEVNLNAGCPSGIVFAKHKGSGMLADLEGFNSFLETVYDWAESEGMKISVKTRMGVHSTAEFTPILEIYNRYPLSSLIIHARDKDGMYLSTPDVKGFAEALKESRCPVVYNGNIFAMSDMKSLITTVPDTESIMVGRGAAANPALIRELQGGNGLESDELREFHDLLLDAYLSSGLCEQFALERMKQAWYYFIHMFSDFKKEQKVILKAGNLYAYRDAVAYLFSSGKFNKEGYFVQIS